MSPSKCNILNFGCVGLPRHMIPKNALASSLKSSVLKTTGGIVPMLCSFRSGPLTCRPRAAYVPLTRRRRAVDVPMTDLPAP